MKLTLRLIAILFLLPACSGASEGYLCFLDPKYPAEKLCYPFDKTDERVPAARNAVSELGENIDDPGSLVEMEGEMADGHSQHQFYSSLKKYFPNLNADSISHILTHGRHSAILLKDHSILFYDHEKAAFIFNYGSPRFFEGLASYYGKGIDPHKDQINIDRLDSNCNLSRDGIIFIAEPKDSVYYAEDGTFCEYNGFYLKDDDGRTRIRRIDQIGQSYSSISRVGFAQFIEWLHEHP